MSNEIRSTVLNLIERKTKIEDEINQLGAILSQNGVGIDDPLVDNEGFPLANVDLYQVRHARQQIICLQNDYKAIMAQIEKGLSAYYETNQTTDRSTRNTGVGTISDTHDLPFAKIVNIEDKSPAYKAGLQNGDLLLQFGSLNRNNFTNISAVANIVQHSLNTDIKLLIKRGNCTMGLKLKPQKWAGKGLLGCVISPLDQ